MVLLENAWMLFLHCESLACLEEAWKLCVLSSFLGLCLHLFHLAIPVPELYSFINKPVIRWVNASLSYLSCFGKLNKPTEEIMELLFKASGSDIQVTT